MHIKLGLVVNVGNIKCINDQPRHKESKDMEKEGKQKSLTVVRLWILLENFSQLTL